MSVEEIFGRDINVALENVERFLASVENEDETEDSEGAQVKRKRDEVDFLSMIGYLRNFIETNIRKHKGRLVLLFRGNDRLDRMKRVAKVKLSDANASDSRWTTYQRRVEVLERYFPGMELNKLVHLFEGGFGPRISTGLFSRLHIHGSVIQGRKLF